MLKTGTQLYTPYLEEAISIAGREKTKKILDSKQRNNSRPLIVIDGQKFTSTVKNIKDNQLEKNEKVLLLPAGIDAAIIETTKEVELALPVGDCGALIAYLKDPNNNTKIIASAHLGYKGVIAGMIENFISGLLKTGNTNNINDFSFHLSPMAGKNFELPIDLFHSTIAFYITSQGLSANSYINLSHNNTSRLKESYNFGSLDITNIQYNKLIYEKSAKIYFDLQKLILDILEKKYRINIPDENKSSDFTTNPRNTLSSFRNHTQAKSIDDNKELLKSLDLENPNSYINLIIREARQKYNYNQEKIFFSSEEVDIVRRIYKITYEQAELLLYEKYTHYTDNNSRLSLSVFTYKDEK